MPNPVGNPNWLAGNSGNPKGRPPGVFHTLSDKRSHFLTTLSRAEILAIAKDEKRLDEYTAFEAQVLLGLAETLMETPENKLDPSAAREKLYDREIGKAAQSVDVKHSGSVAVFTVDMSQALDFLAGDGAGSEEKPIGGNEIKSIGLDAGKPED